jgi:hypothetical protein
VVVPARETVAGEAFMRVSTSNMSFTLSVMGMRSPGQDTQREGQKEEGEIHIDGGTHEGINDVKLDPVYTSSLS